MHMGCYHSINYEFAFVLLEDSCYFYKA